MQNYNVTLITERNCNELNLDAWKMNILSVDLDRQFLVIGCVNFIQFYSITGLNIQPLEKSKIDEDDSINHIKQHKNQLFATTMKSFVYIYDLDNILRRPLKLQGLYEQISDCSIWSIDICDKYIAVGSNSTIISLWSQLCLNFEAPDYKYYDDRKIRVNYTKEDLENDKVEFPIRYSIHNHKHNIPCVQFSPCYKYLASGSIDSVLRVYAVENGSELFKIQFQEWVWSIQWMKYNQDNDNDDNNNEINKEYSENDLLDYSLIIGFQNKLSVCGFVSEKFQYQLYKTTSQRIQRYQKLIYFNNFDTLIVIPQHDSEIVFFELQNIDSPKIIQDQKIKLNSEALLSIDAKECNDSILILSLTWNKMIRIHRVKFIDAF